MSMVDCNDVECSSDTSSSYDSVCFGEYTMDEAKKDIRKGFPRKIERRHSAIYEHYDKSSEAEVLAAHFDQTANISSNPAEYFTPNETAMSEARPETHSQEFLDKLCRAINDPGSGSFYDQQSEVFEERTELVSNLSYSTALDQQSVCYEHGDELQNKVSNVPDNQLEDSILDNSVITVSDDSLLETSRMSDEDLKESSSAVKICVEEYQESTSDFAEGHEEASKEIDFDDTLEEINRFLEQGTEYVMRENSPCQATAICGLSVTPDQPKNKIKKSYSAGKIPKPSCGIGRPRTEPKPKFWNTETKIKPPSGNVKDLFSKRTPTFKVPSKPIKKAATPVTKLSSNPDMKNIVSPVGIYINHTRKYSPMIKVPTQNKTRLFLEPQLSQSQQTSRNVVEDVEIPSVIYRPAKTKIVSEIRDVNLPGKIEKLVSPQVVIKHEKRIERDICNESVERRLQESDISIDVSQCEDVSDISIVTHKQPFNLRKF